MALWMHIVETTRDPRVVNSSQFDKVFTMDFYKLTDEKCYIANAINFPVIIIMILVREDTAKTRISSLFTEKLRIQIAPREDVTS